ncbi:hypothetical protein CHI10_21905 [Bacillus sp. 7894-2]|nr:hypothetical protein CHI10_21905 [Bacillus sp. 7894-2]
MINNIGDQKKTKEYFFLKFEKDVARNMAREVDHYICTEFADDLRDPDTANGIGYSRNEGKNLRP